MAETAVDALLGRLDEDARARTTAADPAYATPMAATLWADVFSDPAWIYERKLDGVRCLAVRDGDEVALWSRNANRMDGAYPELVEALAAQPLDRFSLDAEVVAFDGDRTSFARLQARMHVRDPDQARATGVAVFLYAFDALNLAGRDLTGLGTRDRKRLLRAAIDFDDPLRFTAHRDADGEAFHVQACADGWEGLIAKRADAPYRHTRSRDWRKLKCSRRQELVVGGWTDPEGSRSHFGALLVGYHEDGRLRYAGRVGTGYADEVLADVAGRLADLARDDSPFDDDVGPRKGVHFVDPVLVGEVAFTEWTRDGRLRHPSFLGLRHDKDPADVVRESPPAT